jgi:hypothetical protein
MSKKLYNAFGELINLNNIETFSSETSNDTIDPTPSCVANVRQNLRNKYRDWMPRNEREKIAIHSVRLIDEANKKVILTKKDIQDLRDNNLTNNQGKQVIHFKIELADATKLVNADINLAIAYIATKVGFTIPNIVLIGDQLIDAIYARRLGISIQKILDSLDDETSISGIISEAKLPKKRLTDGIRLAGNLEMDGTIKASAFYLSDGSIMEEVPKLALPNNVYYEDSKIGINRKNPKTTLDIAGSLGVDHAITSTEILTKKIKSDYTSSSIVNSDTMNTMRLNVKNPKNKNNPTGLGTHFNWNNKAENYIRGNTEMRGNTKFTGPFQVTIENPTNDNNRNGWETHFNWENKGENYIRGKTELRGDVNFMGPSSLNIENNKTENNPSGLSTHFNYKNGGENYIRGNTEIRGDANVYGKFCIYDPNSKNPVCIDSKFVTDMKTMQSTLEANLKDITAQLIEVKKSSNSNEKQDSKMVTTNEALSKLEITNYNADIEIDANATDDKPRQYKNTKLNQVFGSNSYEIAVIIRIDKNSKYWRNVYHYGNKNSERSPSLFIKPNDPWTFQFIIRTNKSWNQTYNFEIPTQFRKQGYPLSIRSIVTKDPNNKKITIQQWVNNEYIGQKIITDSYLDPLYNKDLWVKNPWHNRQGYRIEKISLKKIN